MKAYSIANPPHCAGLYHLTNKRTGHVYVGKSTGLARRYREWKAGLASGFGHVNIQMSSAMRENPDLDEWFFVVVKEMPGCTPEELQDAEVTEIARVTVERPELCLNVPDTMQAPQQWAEDNTSSRVLIVTPEGGYVGQTIAARMLNRSLDTISEKVRWLRGQGVKEVQLKDLTLDRRKILEKIRSTTC